MIDTLRAVLIATALLAIQPVVADSASSRFARVVNDDDGNPRALQMAVVTYAPGGAPADFTVDLVSAIHIGDKAYYDELNRRFQDYDILLYELIVPGEQAASAIGSGGGNLLSTAQIGLKNALNLSFQLEEVDYGAANFVHADLTTTALTQQMRDRDESLYVYFWRLFFVSMNAYASDPLGTNDMRLLSQIFSGDENDAIKIALARQMVDASRSFDMLAGTGSGSAVIAARNEHALSILRRELDAGAKRIGIFYGVGHMPDFERRLGSEFALKKSGTLWLDAWRFGKAENKSATPCGTGRSCAIPESSVAH